MNEAEYSYQYKRGAGSDAAAECGGHVVVQ